MKKIVYLFILILTFSCSKDDSNNNAKINVFNAPYCPSPSNLNATNITSGSAKLNWQGSDVSSSFQIEYGHGGFMQGYGITQSTIETYLDINLESSTEYDFYVRSKCVGNNYSEWSGPFSFVTESN